EQRRVPRQRGRFDRHKACCEAQFTMAQPPFVSASMGETVGISCTRSSGGIRSKWNHWYQQKPNSAPILLIYNDEERVSGIPERFSGSYDTSANSVTLTISNVQAEDEAHYYCQEGKFPPNICFIYIIYTIGRT
uniref:Ig-like domain-containing protein n=1 Tax=Podarcis muralis TaxID=64176 RepID=A0A670K094_PODMU